MSAHQLFTKTAVTEVELGQDESQHQVHVIIITVSLRGTETSLA